MQDQIREILIDIRPEYDFLGSENFIQSGMLDSFDILTLVTELEEKFDIKVDGAEILAENFCSIDAIANLVKSSKKSSE